MAKEKHTSKVSLDKKDKKEKTYTQKTIELPSEQIKQHKVKINKVENNAVIVKIGGYDKRIYFDLNFKELEYIRDHKNAYINKMLTIYYMGDITNAFGVTILRIKNLSDIGSR